MNSRLSSIVALATLATAVSLPALAQAQDKDATRRLQMQLQKAAQDKAAAEREKADLAAKLQDAERKAADAEQTRKALSIAQRQAATARRVPELEQQLQAARDAQSKLEESLRATQARADAQARQIESLTARVSIAEQRAQKLEAALASGRGELESCDTRNRTLVTTGRELVDALADGQCPAKARFDPLLQLGRVEFERRLEGYRDRIAEARYRPAATPPSR